MSGPVHGLIEVHIPTTANTTGSTQAVFISLYNFLNNNTGTMGLQRIAFNSGSTPSGAPAIRGMNFYDQPNPAGENAWFCFRFLSASVPFDFLCEWSFNNVINTAPGTPAKIGGSVNNAGLGVAVGMRTDGGPAWNGSSGSNPGSDTKGTPVWQKSAPGTGSYFFPRSNDLLGSFVTNKEDMISIEDSEAAQTLGTQMQMLGDYDTVCMLLDYGNNASYDQVFYFGKYAPVTGSAATAPYVMLHQYKTSGGTTSGMIALAGSAATPTNVFGTLAGNSTTNNDGAVAHPNPLSGSANVVVDAPSYLQFANATFFPNKPIAGTPQYDEILPSVVLYDTNMSQFGYLGSIDWFRFTAGVSTNDTNATFTRAFFGSSTQTDKKVSYPWSSGTVPGSGVSRGGVSF